MIIAKDTTGTQFPKLPLPEAGTTQAVCCAVWDLGLQKKEYMGEMKTQHKIIIAWEVTELIMVQESEFYGKPYMLSKTYTLSLGEKANLRKDLESWRGQPFSEEELKKGFNVEKLYGVNCLIGIKHEPDRNKPDKIYANVSAILPLTKGMEKITPFRTKDEAPPKWVQEKIDAQIKQTETPAAPEENPFGLEEI